MHLPETLDKVNYPKPNRDYIEERLPPGTLSNHEEGAIWGFFLRSSDPSEVAHTYRSYRDSPHCGVSKDKLRAMRDTLIRAMRDYNKELGSPAKERRKGVHFPDYHSDEGYRVERMSA